MKIVYAITPDPNNTQLAEEACEDEFEAKDRAKVHERRTGKPHYVVPCLLKTEKPKDA